MPNDPHAHGFSTWMVRTAADIPWRLVIATRNRLIHAYLGIDNHTLWSIIQTDIPALQEKMRKLKEAGE